MSKNKNTLLWEIRGDAIPSPSYVFGTMHVQDERAFRNVDFIESCILKTDAFAAEYDLDIENPEAFHDIALLPEGQKLSELISPKIYAKLSKVFLRESGLKLQYFEDKKPVIILNMLGAAQFSEERQISLDQYLYNFAKTESKEMLGIESFESQLEIMRKMPMKDQLKSLKEMALNFGRYRRNIKKTTALYLEGDLIKILKKVKQTSGGMRKLLLYDRNLLMASRIAEIASGKSLFAAIGAGHLGGKKGVLRLLKKAGFEVRGVPY